MAYDSGWTKGVVEWREGETLCLSVPFTWLVNEARNRAKSHNGPVVIGGPGVYLLHPVKCDWATVLPTTSHDVLRLHHLEATFTTRGCPRQCPYCAVPKIEGRFRELDVWQPKRLICDANFLSASRKHIEAAVDRLRHISGVEFNQGLDARLFNGWRVDALSTLRKPVLRFAYDSASDEAPVADAVRLAKQLRIKVRGVYVLYNFRETQEEARNRMEQVRSWGVLPFPMRYQPLDALRKSAYVAPQWTQYRLRVFASYYSRLAYLGHISFEEFSMGSLSSRQMELWKQ